MQPFHIAVPVHDLDIARNFYSSVMGFKEGRSDTQWVDFSMYGHQFVIHELKGKMQNVDFNPVDDHAVPIPHFGVVLQWDDFHELAEKLKVHKIKFLIEPYIRFEGKPGEQATMFFQDPSGNALEFKAFKDISQLFAKN